MRACDGALGGVADGGGSGRGSAAARCRGHYAPLVSDHRFVFVTGLHRSGTSLLARCIAQHPQVSGFSGTGVPEDEGQLLQSVYPPGHLDGGPGRFGFAQRQHLTEHSPQATPESRERLWQEWSPHWDLERPVLLEKSPPHLTKTRFLQALFPEHVAPGSAQFARFIGQVVSQRLP